MGSFSPDLATSALMAQATFGQPNLLFPQYPQQQAAAAQFIRAQWAQWAMLSQQFSTAHQLSAAPNNTSPHSQQLTAAAAATTGGFLPFAPSQRPGKQKCGCGGNVHVTRVVCRTAVRCVGFFASTVGASFAPSPPPQPHAHGSLTAFATLLRLPPFSPLSLLFPSSFSPHSLSSTLENDRCSLFFSFCRVVADRVLRRSDWKRRLTAEQQK